MASSAEKKIVIVGYGGHARSMADSIKSAGEYEICGYTDLRASEDGGLTYLGSDDNLEEIYASGIHCAVVGVGFMGNSDLRDKMYDKLKKIGYKLPAIVDPSAILAADAVIGEGTFVGKRAVVNASASVGKMCIINTGAIVEHEDVIGDYTHIAVGTTLCGQVAVGEHTLVGAGSVVIQGKHIGDHCIVGANSTVIRDLPDGCKAMGSPAKSEM